MTFDFFTPKFDKHICEPKYICEQNCVKSLSLVFRIVSTIRPHFSPILTIFRTYIQFVKKNTSFGDETGCGLLGFYIIN